MFLFATMLCLAISEAPTVSLSGTVVGPKGEPVAGAEVLLAGLPANDPPILARGRTDAGGRFAIERPAGLAAKDRFNAPILWVAKPGYRLGFVRFSGPMPGAVEPVRVALGPPGKAEIRVEGPDGAPMAGARVRIQWLGPQSTYVPDEVGEGVEATTGKDGVAFLDVGSNDEVTYVDVHAPGFGIQGRPFLPANSKPKLVRLRATTTLEGRVVADDPAMLKGWRVSAWTRLGDRWSSDPATTGFASGVTDAEGRFAFPAIAPGGLQLSLKPPRELPVLTHLPGSTAVVQGRANAIEIPLHKAVRITGTVRERGTDRPVAGVEMNMIPLDGGNHWTNEMPRTDAQGRYAFLCLPGLTRISMFGTPPTHAQAPGPHWRDITIPEGAPRLELEPFEVISAAPPLRFVVRDESGKPAAHAVISGQAASRYMPRETDDRGEFAIPGLPPGSEVSIEVRDGARMTDEPVKAVAGGTDPVPITIVPGLTIALEGRVLGPGGAPIPGASVRAEFRQIEPRPGVPHFFPQPVGFGKNSAVRTGSDGTFRTPKDVYRKGRDFRVEATADGYFPGRSDWYVPEEGDRVTFPDLVLRPRLKSRPIAGRVVDRQGRGVAGAMVMRSIAGMQGWVTADGEGRFRLADVPGGAAPVFADAAGFRFGGTIVGPGESVAEIRLARVGEPPLAIPKPQPPPLSRAEERAMARELLGPVLAAARTGSLGYLGQSVLPALARADPDRVLEMLENRVVAPSARIIGEVALAQAEVDPAAAVATIEADRNPADRAAGFLSLADAAPIADAPRRIEWIDRALAEARRVENKPERLRLLGRVADHWIDLGQVDRARPILLEGRRIVASLPRETISDAVESFAEVLAVVDLRTAQTIFKRNGREHVNPAARGAINRHLAEAALRLAAIDPAEAERLIPEDEPDYWNAPYEVLRICRRMARADLPRARRILAKLDRPIGRRSSSQPTLVPRGLGLMALDRAATDPASALPLLNEAFDRLRKVAGKSDGSNSYEDIPCVMAGLLPLVERIDPDRLEERLRLAAASEAPLGEGGLLQTMTKRMTLAALVSRYDRATADALAAPALARIPRLLTAWPDHQYGDLVLMKAAAVYDPRAVTELLRALPASARKAPDPKRNGNAAGLDAQVRLAAAQMLGLSVDERFATMAGWVGLVRVYGQVR